MNIYACGIEFRRPKTKTNNKKNQSAAEKDLGKAQTSQKNQSQIRTFPRSAVAAWRNILTYAKEIRHLAFLLNAEMTNWIEE